jgi:hypothetical protein
MTFHLFVNGVEVSIIPGFDTHCCVQKLNPNTKYKLDLVAVNPKGFKAKSRSVYIKTKSAELQARVTEVLLENPDSLFKLLTDKSAKDPTSVHKVGTTQTAEIRNGRSRSNTLNSVTNENTSVMPSAVSALLIDPKSMEDIEELRYHLEAGQDELHDILNQQARALSEFKEQEHTLIEDRKTLRERKKLEDGNRQSIKSEITMLDDARRLADLKKAKQETLLQSKKRSINKMEKELSEWNDKIESFDRDRERMEASEDKVHAELDSDIAMKQITIKQLQFSLLALEETIKSQLQQKKQKESVKPQLINVFRTLRQHTNSSGIIDSDGVKALELLKTLDPEYFVKVQDEVDTDAKLEATWRAEQQREVSHCHKVNQMFESLKAENKELKAGIVPERTKSITPTGSLSPSAVPLQHSNSVYSNFSIPVPSNGTSNNASGSSPFTYPNMNTAGSPSLAPFSQQKPLWSSTGLSLNYRPNSLSLDTSLAPDFLTNTDDLESPSVQHYLPANLIGEELPEFMFNDSRESDLPGSDGINSGDGSTPNLPNASLINSGNSVASFNQNMLFNNADFNANVSTRSIFHNEFNMTPGYPVERASSPPQSFQNDLLSSHNSPVNPTATDLSSIFSGGTTDNIRAQLSAGTPQETKHNVFSPRRLSHVFGFGRKNAENEDHVPQPVSAQKQRSKFFDRSGHDVNPIKSSGDSSLFHMDYHHDQTEKLAFNHLWGDKSPFSNKIHSRNVSQASAASLEKDDKSWSKFHNDQQQVQHMSVPSSHSMSSDAVSDSTDLGPVIHHSETNKSAAVTVKSSKSSLESSQQPVSPSFFRKKNFFSFGQNGSQSPIKQSTAMFHSGSPSKIDIPEESVEEYNPTSATNNTPKRLFSKGRKSSAVHSRKQSSSSIEADHAVVEAGSIQSGSTGNSRSIVRRLSFFTKSNASSNGHKDIGHIDEQVEDD